MRGKGHPDRASAPRTGDAHPVRRHRQPAPGHHRALTLAGGILLLWVCWKFLGASSRHGAPAAACRPAKRYGRKISADEIGASSRQGGRAPPAPPPAKSMRQAVIQIVLADVSMSLDNVLGGRRRPRPSTPGSLFSSALAAFGRPCDGGGRPASSASSLESAGPGLPISASASSSGSSLGMIYRGTHEVMDQMNDDGGLPAGRGGPPPAEFVRPAAPQGKWPAVSWCCRQAGALDRKSGLSLPETPDSRDPPRDRSPANPGPPCRLIVALSAPSPIGPELYTRFPGPQADRLAGLRGQRGGAAC